MKRLETNSQSVKPKRMLAEEAKRKAEEDVGEGVDEAKEAKKKLKRMLGEAEEPKKG